MVKTGKETVMEYQIFYRSKDKKDRNFQDWVFMSAYKAQKIIADERGAYHPDQHIDLGYVMARSRVLREMQSVHHGFYGTSKDFEFKITEGADYFSAADGEQNFIVVDLKKEDLPEKRWGDDEIFRAYLNPRD